MRTPLVPQQTSVLITKMTHFGTQSPGMASTTKMHSSHTHYNMIEMAMDSLTPKNLIVPQGISHP